MGGATTMFTRERGAVAVITAILMVVLVGVLALVVDAGLAYQERRQLQTAVDAASLAGAQELAEGGSETAVRSVANGYVKANANVTPSAVIVSFPAENQVRVSAITDREAVFSRIFGFQQLKVAAAATARYGVVSSTIGVVPFMVPFQVVDSHIGEDNAGTFELGSDRPAPAFRKTSMVSGNTVTYEIFYENTGQKSSVVTIRDPLPSGVEYVDGSASGGGSYDVGAKEVRWSATLQPGESVTVTFQGTVTGSPGRNTAYAKGSSGSEESALENDESQRGFFWLADFTGGGAGTPDYENWITNGYQEDVNVDQVGNGTGMRAALDRALEKRMAADPSVIVPLFDYTEGSGSQGEYHVKGFAEFVITGFDLSGKPKTVSGYFTTGTVVGGNTGGSALDYGVTAVGLVE